MELVAKELSFAWTNKLNHGIYYISYPQMNARLPFLGICVWEQHSVDDSYPGKSKAISTSWAEGFAGLLGECPPQSVTY